MTNIEIERANSYLKECDEAWGIVHNEVENTMWQHGMYEHELSCALKVLKSLRPLTYMVHATVARLCTALATKGCAPEGEVSRFEYEDADTKTRKWQVVKIIDLIRDCHTYSQVLWKLTSLTDRYVRGYHTDGVSTMSQANSMMMEIVADGVARVAGYLENHVAKGREFTWDAGIAAIRNEGDYRLTEYIPEEHECYHSVMRLTDSLDYLMRRIDWVRDDVEKCIAGVELQIHVDLARKPKKVGRFAPSRK
jgi:hypothetical protein